MIGTFVSAVCIATTKAVVSTPARRRRPKPRAEQCCCSKLPLRPFFGAFGNVRINLRKRGHKFKSFLKKRIIRSFSKENISFEIVNKSCYSCFVKIRRFFWRLKMKVLFVLWVGIIPLVPLVGVQLFRQRGEKKKASVCRLLFAAQLLLSFTYAAVYFNLFG